MIIERKDTQDPFFERAILFVKDSHRTHPEQALDEQAHQYLATMRRGNKIGFLRVQKCLHVLHMGLAGVGGAVLAFFLMQL